MLPTFPPSVLSRTVAVFVLYLGGLKLGLQVIAKRTVSLNMR